jgi:hypothetical protein
MANTTSSARFVLHWLPLCLPSPTLSPPSHTLSYHSCTRACPHTHPPIHPNTHTQTHTHTHTQTHMDACMHARTHAHTHTTYTYRHTDLVYMYVWRGLWSGGRCVDGAFLPALINTPLKADAVSDLYSRIVREPLHLAKDLSPPKPVIRS